MTFYSLMTFFTLTFVSLITLRDMAIPVTDIFVSRDGQKTVVLYETTAEVWDIVSMSRDAVYDDQIVSDIPLTYVVTAQKMAWTQDASRMALVAPDGQSFSVYERGSSTPLYTIENREPTVIDGVIWRYDGAVLVPVHSRFAEHINFYDGLTGRLQKTVPVEDVREVTWMSFQPDDTILAVTRYQFGASWVDLYDTEPVRKLSTIIDAGGIIVPAWIRWLNDDVLYISSGQSRMPETYSLESDLLSRLEYGYFDFNSAGTMGVRLENDILKVREVETGALIGELTFEEILGRESDAEEKQFMSEIVQVRWQSDWIVIYNATVTTFWNPISHEVLPHH